MREHQVLMLFWNLFIRIYSVTSHGGFIFLRWDKALRFFSNYSSLEEAYINIYDVSIAVRIYLAQKNANALDPLRDNPTY